MLESDKEEEQVFPPFVSLETLPEEELLRDADKPIAVREIGILLPNDQR